MKINNFRGDLTDISAKKEALKGGTYCKALPACVFQHLVGGASRLGDTKTIGTALPILAPQTSPTVDLCTY